MNWHAIRAIYRFEMARTFRTITQSIASPVLSTSLYFVVFGAAIGSRMGEIDGVSYGAFIIPGLIMLSLLNESISNASFGIYMPKWAGTIYELLSAPVSYVEVVLGYVGAAATKSMMLGVLILVTARIFVPYEIAHPLLMAYVGHVVWRMLSDGAFAATPFHLSLFFVDITNIFGSYAAFVGLGWAPMKPRERAAVGWRWTLVPAYWMLISLAAWRAVGELHNKPFFWNKTAHRPTTVKGGERLKAAPDGQGEHGCGG